MTTQTDNLNIFDDSGDKKYFTIIPNYILNHSTLYDREVYIQMKRYAGEDGTCWASKTTLMKRCGMGKERLKKSIQYLLDHKWITYLGEKKVMTNGGEQFVSEYKINNLWKKNADYYEGKGGSPQTTLDTKGGRQSAQRGVAKGGSPQPSKKNHIKEEPIKEDGVANATFVNSKFIDDLENSERRDLQVIGFYFKERGLKFETREQANSTLRRHLKSAKEVANFTDKQIVAVTEKLKKDFPAYTIETIYKNLTK